MPRFTASRGRAPTVKDPGYTGPVIMVAVMMPAAKDNETASTEELEDAALRVAARLNAGLL